MTAILICERFGWTWDEYQEQPAMIIETIMSMMHAEAKESNKAKKQNRR